MRIISGKLKGRRLLDFKNLGIRPTTDQAKEGLFNVLTHKIDFENLEILDLFAGTGSISYEFISRGAKKSTSIDNQKASTNYISKMSKALSIEDQILVYREDALKFLQKKNHFSYDFIFADPPFKKEFDYMQSLIEPILSKNWLKKDGIFILEHFFSANLLKSHPYLIETRSYSKINFSFFRSEISDKSIN